MEQDYDWSSVKLQNQQINNLFRRNRLRQRYRQRRSHRRTRRNTSNDADKNEWIRVEARVCVNSGLLHKQQSFRNLCRGKCNGLRWKYGRWSRCSSECGTGNRQRSVFCVDNRGYRFAKKHCRKQKRRLRLKPLTEKCRSVRACKPHMFYWKTGTYSKCSQSCEWGEKRRQVRCVMKSEQHEQEEKEREEHRPAAYLLSSGQNWSGRVRRRRSSSRSSRSSEKFRKFVHDWFCRSMNIRKPEQKTRCFLEKCFVWRPVVRGKCSKSCGLGKISIEYVCVPYRNQHKKIDDTYCQSTPRPQNYSRKCRLRKCRPSYYWEIGQWNKCSALCGGGIQYRSVKCSMNDTENHIYKWRLNTDSDCDQSVAHHKYQFCNQEACPEWVTGPWSRCRGSCEFGTQYRYVHCMKFDKSVVHDSKCFRSARPKNNRRCLLKVLCGFWKTTDWSPCSTTCGLGVKTRKVYCKSYNNKLYPSQKCPANHPPKQIYCQQRLTCRNSPYYAHRNVSKCIAQNCKAGGIQYFDVYCAIYKNLRIRMDHCRHLTFPGTQNPCSLDHCRKYSWKNKWDECSQKTCQIKLKPARFFCVDEWDNQVESYKCSSKSRSQLERWQHCKQPSYCSSIPRSCKEIKRRYPDSPDGDYPMRIFSNFTGIIYCHNMKPRSNPAGQPGSRGKAETASSEPSEYLSLKKDNYASTSPIILGPSLSRNAEQICPRIRQNFDIYKCRDCKINYQLESNTFFYKLKINISTLVVDLWNGQFSRTFGRTFVPFGTARDCSQLVNCPLGMFVINLVDTGFKVSQETEWKYPDNSQISIIERFNNSRIVSGRCGGNCSGCQPFSGLILRPDEQSIPK